MLPKILMLVTYLFTNTVYYTKVETTIYETVEQAIVREFKEECPTALAVFRGESGLRPNAIGDHGTSVGIAQIHIPAHSKKIPSQDKEEWLKNFQNNLRLAKQIKDASGWNAWSFYKSGGYLQFLDYSCLKYIE